MTDPPAFQPTETEAKISVPQEAANTVIGFRDLIAGVDEGTAVDSNEFSVACVIFKKLMFVNNLQTNSSLTLIVFAIIKEFKYVKKI